MKKATQHEFIPATMEREIAKDIVFRPIRSWHSATYAGEKLQEMNGDHSGCMELIQQQGFMRKQEMCRIPYTVTHRQYWHRKNPNELISAFLSYPNAMGCWDTYFWEIYPTLDGNEKRFDSEKKMEKAIVRILKTHLTRKKRRRK
jgi:hypothetical protein